ncbi:YgiT-type zinc finger protein [Leptospira sp. WS58.C1]|uniref:YgiT-type zinc finger protein n=1 Tax=Leptospira cinconiae TaxID=3235173 RepID=UPI00349EB1A6
MRDKLFKDCPVCGTIGSMENRISQSLKISSPRTGPFTVRGLSGQYCKVCGEGFLDIKSIKILKISRARKIAEADSLITPAAKILSIESIAQKTGIKKQNLFTMIHEGALPYVIDGEGKERATLETLKAAILYKKKRAVKVRANIGKRIKIGVLKANSGKTLLKEPSGNFNVLSKSNYVRSSENKNPISSSKKKSVPSKKSGSAKK